VLFNDAANSKDYITLVVDEWLSTDHWWNDTDSGNWSTRIKTSPCHFVHHKSQCTGLGLNLGLHDDRLSTNCLSHRTGCQNVNDSVCSVIVICNLRHCQVRDCVTVQISVHEQTLHSPCTAISVWSAPLATLLLHHDMWPAFTSSCTDNGSTWRCRYCLRTWKHKQCNVK
jgi:hypothetical protein